MSWILRQGALAAGVTFSVPGIQRLAMSMHKVMLDNGIYLEYQSHIDDTLAALEQDAK
jgi:hypothetical protein